MGGGLLQLVAYGAQDVYLTGNPQITFFKVVYRRHTNFAMESIEQSFNGNNNFGSSVSVLITRNGDLINRIYFNGKIKNNAAAGTAVTGALKKVTITDGGSNYTVGDVLTIDDGATGSVTDAQARVDSVSSGGAITNLTIITKGSGFTSLTSLSASGGSGNSVTLDVAEVEDTMSTNVDLVPYFGQRLLKTIELEIGGQKIDKHYSEWLYVWNELSMTAGKKSGYQTMVGGNSTNSVVSLSGQKSYEVYVPLEFWFCRNVGLALPLIALQYHEVKINITYASKTEMVAYGSSSDLQMNDVGLWVDYIFLDTDERRRFAQLSHEYLIEQLQFTGTDTIDASSSGAMKSVRMTFNHPCKELIWFVQPEGNGVHWNNFSANISNDYKTHGKNPVTMAKIQLNGNDRFAEREGTYFSTVQPYQHHECTPGIYTPGINVYSFALKPEEHQPSGTLNMSRIDTAVLSMSSTSKGTVSVYAVNYNVLRILSGMGGLAYSN